MAVLVSVGETQLRLNIPSTDETELLVRYLIEDASAMIITHLKDQAELLLDFDTSGEFVEGSDVPGAIRAATIMLVGYMYENRDGDPDGAFSGSNLPAPVVVMLNPLRDPALA